MQMVVGKVMANVSYSLFWSHVHPSELLRTVDEFCLWLCSPRVDSETRINVKGIDQEILSGKNSKGSGIKNGRSLHKGSRFRKVQRVTLAQSHRGALGTVQIPLSTAVPSGLWPPTLWGGNIISRHFVLSVCAGKDGCGNSSVVLQLGDTRLAVWNNNIPELLSTTLGKGLEGV